jgi:hypothetical protein
MHFILAILFSLSFQANSLPSFSLDQGSISKGSPEIVLHLKAPQVTATNVKLGYEIPYPGYIEFHLFDGKGEKIWADYGVREKGEHYQSLKRDKLEAGTKYQFEFWYKGKPYPGSFSL